ncbi:MAG: pirin family protein [Alphaproteobacteria bacterium]|mgnify:CR=1 FL=1|nr:pirin family protein [Alphaproteobacteria bacterium]OJV47034.1 MAG: hypothetical protein BGO28_01120 [Alphaproteobacteria bacterium 43-37]
MIHHRPSSSRGFTELSWLKSHHTFSFGQYFDQSEMGFGPIRVINEDWIEPNSGFKTHPHNNMEIITYIVEGKLQHKDSLGNGSIIMPGDAQRMSAGRGIEHSEFNPSMTEPVHLLQIWIGPDILDLDPSYEQKKLTRLKECNHITLLASPNGENGSVKVHQQIKLYALTFDEATILPVQPHTCYWIQTIKGQYLLNDIPFMAGDGARIMEEDSFELKPNEPSHILLFQFDQSLGS